MSEQTTIKKTSGPTRSYTGGSGGVRSGAGGSSRPPRTFADRPKPEFDQKIIDIRRVTRVMAGGRRMSFAVALAIGDKKGSVGLGTGKGADTALAIAKALKSARKSMITIKTNKEMSIRHDIAGKDTSSKVIIMPNNGRGLVSGSSVRDLLVLAGIKNVTSKIISGSKNPLNNARATMNALSQISTPRIARAAVKENE